MRATFEGRKLIQIHPLDTQHTWHAPVLDGKKKEGGKGGRRGRRVYLRLNRVKIVDTSRLDMLINMAQCRPLWSARYPITSWPIKSENC
jgi:hypothetical protein